MMTENGDEKAAAVAATHHQQQQRLPPPSGGEAAAHDNDELSMLPQPPRKKTKKKLKESIIDHTYRDFSQVNVASLDDDDDDDNGGNDGADDNDGGNKTKGGARGKSSGDTSKTPVNFPAKLHAIVSDPRYQHIICWMPHGRSWKIVDKHLLTNVIIPTHFAHSKFESFNRSVNGWGFKRLLGEGPDKKTYYHECFLRGRPELTKLMQRLCNPGKRLPDKSGEPNFYEISEKFPLPPGLPPVPPSGVLSPQDQNIPQIPTLNHAPPQRGQEQPVMFAPPPHPQVSGYAPYGYAQPSSHYSMLSSTPNNNQGSANVPKQELQHSLYWHNPVALPPFQPNPSEQYGYYPTHPQMMMAPPQAGGPMGYYFFQPCPPQHAAMQHSQNYLQAPAASAPAVMAAPMITGWPGGAAIDALYAQEQKGVKREAPGVDTMRNSERSNGGTYSVHKAADLVEGRQESRRV